MQAEVRSQDIGRSIRRLDAWVAKNGWAGYDPYDIRACGLFRKMETPGGTGTAARLLRTTAYRAEFHFPLLLRRLLRVRKQINPKGMGLFARAYLNLYAATGEAIYRQKAVECLDWLLAHPAAGVQGLGWGYPFDWQSRVLIPRGTPSAVVSSVVGDAFWTAHELLRDPRYLETCMHICTFFEQDLNVSEPAAGCVCFSYTPIDNFQVHNANLFVAEFLTRVGKATKDETRCRLGLAAAAFALREQNPDGSLYYWGRDQDAFAPRHIDHYHSGFEIRALTGLWQNTGNDAFRDAFHRYYAFYRSRLFSWNDDACIPLTYPNRDAPVNIHSCAEAILCNTRVRGEFPGARDLALGTFRWTVDRMQNRDGSFGFAGSPDRQLASIPYIRWGQAWMLLALSELYRAESPGAADLPEPAS